MVGRLNRRRAWVVALALLLSWSVSRPAAAQGSSGMAAGTVKDAKGTPVEGAIVVFQSTESTRKIETKTDKKGEFFQLGLAPGNYTISASKGDLASVPSPTRILSDQTLKTEMVLVDKKAAASAAAAGGGDAAAKAAAAKVAEFTTTFEAGVAASSAGRQDEAIEKFTAALTLSPGCYDCHNNIGYAYLQKKEYDKAEASYLKGNEVKPNQASYSGLASVYTAQKKLDQAAAAMSKATELSATAGATGGNADALFNQGVTLWNSGKIEDAKTQFQAAIQANPNHAEAHYQLGMALLNEGNMTTSVTEFETYLKLAPSGPNAATAKSMLDTLKK